MYQPGILMKAYNGFMKAAKIRGVRAEDILFLCVCVVCHDMPWQHDVVSRMLANCGKIHHSRMCGSPCVLHLVVCLHVFAMVHLRAYHPRSTGIREEEAPLVSEMNTNFQ